MMQRRLLCSLFGRMPREAKYSQLRSPLRTLIDKKTPFINHFCSRIEPLYPVSVSSNYVSNRTFKCSSSIFSQDDGEKKERVGLAKKFKQMFKDYWYVLVPVHVATSAVWLGGFYFMCKSGIDVGAVLQFFGASEKYVEKLSNSSMGYFALAYACYKIATPVRYTVTIAGTTMTVKHLSELGYLKTTQQVADEMREKRDNLAEEMREKKEHFIERRDNFAQEMKERKDHMRDEWTEAWHKFAQRGKKKP